LRAARAYLFGTAAQVWSEIVRTGIHTEEQRAMLRLASTWTIHQSATVVDTAYHMAGATAVFRSNKFERRFRDMHAIAQQIQARDTHYEDVGRALLATDPNAVAAIL
jgi:alkylation response protein AidB-like acyl-CoA dehydrogenase